MSDRMSVTEAREWLPMAESHDVNANISRLLRTAISQAEQIERLQAALRDAEVQRREVWVSNGAKIDPQGKVHWDYQYPALLPSDMEPPEGLTRKGM